MCRILYIQSPDIFLKKFGKKKVKEFLDFLERSNGGHGNGIGGLVEMNGKKKFIIHKGTGYSTEKSVNDMEKYRWVNGVLWHTRLASSGSIKSDHNHPFIDEYRILIAIHNGHISNAERLLNILKIFDPIYRKYSYDYGYEYYGFYGYGRVNVQSMRRRNAKNVTDTWIATNFLSLLLRYAIIHGFSVKDVFKRFYSEVLNYDNFIVQLFDGTVVLMINKGSAFQYVIDDEIGFIAASEGLERLGYDRYYIGTGIIWIDPSGEIELIINNFREEVVEEKKVEGKIISMYEETAYLDECFDICFDKCIEKTGDPVICNRVCNRVCSIDEDFEEEIEDVIDEFIAEYE